MGAGMGVGRGWGNGVRERCRGRIGEGSSSGLYGWWDNNYHLKFYCSSSTAAKEGQRFGFFLYCFEHYFQKVSRSHSLTFWHKISPQSKQFNLTSRWRHLKGPGRLGAISSYCFDWPRFRFRFSIMNPQFIPSDNTVQKLISSWLKRPKYSIAVVSLDAVWYSVSCFGIHFALTLLIPILFA